MPWCWCRRCGSFCRARGSRRRSAISGITAASSSRCSSSAGAALSVFTLWLPEQYPTECRASAFAFATSSGRFVAAGVTFLVGAGVARYGSIGVPVAFTSLAFLGGLLVLPFAEETKGQPLPK